MAASALVYNNLEEEDFIPLESAVRQQAGHGSETIFWLDSKVSSAIVESLWESSVRFAKRNSFRHKAYSLASRIHLGTGLISLNLDRFRYLKEYLWEWTILPNSQTFGLSYKVCVSWLLVNTNKFLWLQTTVHAWFYKKESYKISYV